MRWQKGQLRDNVVSLQASSFQLMGTETFRPKISVLTNLYDAHLDYHGSFEAYAAAKAAITSEQQEDDFLIYNADQGRRFERLHQHRTQSKSLFLLRERKKYGITADDTEYILERRTLY